MRTGVWNGDDVRDDLFLAQSLVIGEEESFVLFYRTAKAAAKLVLMEGWRLCCRFAGFDCRIEEVPRFEFVVTQELVCGAVQSVRARVARRINDRSIPAKLSRVSIRQRLEFSDGLHTKCRPHPACAWSIVPEIHHVLVIEQIRLSGGTRSGNRILLTVTIECAPCSWSA